MLILRALETSSLLEILFEDADLLAVNKPADLVCHPTKAGPLSSLISRARLYLGAGATCSIINRLDRETSGILLVAKKRSALKQLQDQFRTRQTGKTYLAMVRGQWPAKLKVLDKP